MPTCEIMRAFWIAWSRARVSIWCLSTSPIASPSAATTTTPMAVNRPSRDMRAIRDRISRLIGGARVP